MDPFLVHAQKKAKVLALRSGEWGIGHDDLDIIRVHRIQEGLFLGEFLEVFLGFSQSALGT